MKDLFFKTIMLKGEAGGTISKIEKTGSTLNVDTYTITLNDGETQTFEVTNGSSIASIEKTDTSGLLDTYTVTLTDGSTTQFVVRNGEDGAGYEVPAGSVLYYDPDGDDSAPEGYEASVDPNGAAIAALKRGVNNNLFFQGLLCAYRSEPVGWRTWVMAGTSPSFIEDGGYLIYADSKALLYTPKFQPYTNIIGNIFDGATYSISVMYKSDQDGIIKTATQEGLAWLQMPTEDIVDEDGIVIGLNSGIMNEVALYIENNSDYDLYILGVKLERGDAATPLNLEGQDVGMGNAINDLIITEEKSISFTAAATSSGNISIDIEKSGYTPIGIVGITGQNTSPLTYSDFYIESDTTAKIYYYNRGSSISVTLVLRVLYKKV